MSLVAPDPASAGPAAAPPDPPHSTDHRAAADGGPPEDPSAGGPLAGTDSPPAPGAARRPATDAERRALASVLRLRILRLCLYEPLTNREIADRLGRNPATVLHHVRTLADQGFLLAGDPRTGRRGSREIPYRATGKSWLLDLGTPTGERTGAQVLVQTFLAEAAMVPPADLDASRLGLQLSAEHEAELRSRLAAVLDEFAHRPQDPGGRRWSVFLAIHPEP